MASKNTAEEIEELLQCAICLDTLCDPRMLACQHTFCLKCLGMLPSHREADDSTVISCPSCREEHTVASVNSLAKNHLVLQLLDTLASSTAKSPRVRSCEECVDNEDRPAQGFCEECRLCMCKQCVEHHKTSRRFAQHSIIAIDAAQPDGEPEGGTTEKSLQKREPICERPSHYGERMEVFCKTHQKACCLKCAVLDHNKCDYTRLEEACDKQSAEIQRKVEALSSGAIDPLTEALAENEEHQQECEERINTLTACIKTDFDQLHKLLDEEQERLLQEVQRKQASDAEVLQRNAGTMKADLQRAQQGRKAAEDLLTNYSQTHVLSQAADTIAELSSAEENGASRVCLGICVLRVFEYTASNWEPSPSGAMVTSAGEHGQSRGKLPSTLKLPFLELTDTTLVKQAPLAVADAEEMLDSHDELQQEEIRNLPALSLSEEEFLDRELPADETLPPTSSISSKSSLNVSPAARDSEGRVLGMPVYQVYQPAPVGLCSSAEEGVDIDGDCDVLEKTLVQADCHPSSAFGIDEEPDSISLLRSTSLMCRDSRSFKPRIDATPFQPRQQQTGLADVTATHAQTASAPQYTSRMHNPVDSTGMTLQYGRRVSLGSLFRDEEVPELARGPNLQSQQRHGHKEDSPEEEFTVQMEPQVETNPSKQARHYPSLREFSGSLFRDAETPDHPRGSTLQPQQRHEVDSPEEEFFNAVPVEPRA
eukprot:scpid54026/ scgid8400/ E3 ubiquitin-protein ligase TRIM33; Ectodermin homolog; Protein moonshine; Transcription intermediary factor 1-gamma; Tripartite motif-containing protein 33